MISSSLIEFDVSLPPARLDVHDRNPKLKRTIPAAHAPASVHIIPVLKRKIARIAATDSASAQRSALAGTGASNARPEARTGVVSRKTVCTANQIARLRITPTTAAVIADNAPASALFPRMDST